MKPPRTALTVQCPYCGLYRRVTKDGKLSQHHVLLVDGEAAQTDDSESEGLDCVWCERELAACVAEPCPTAVARQGLMRTAASAPA